MTSWQRTQRPYRFYMILMGGLCAFFVLAAITSQNLKADPSEGTFWPATAVGISTGVALTEQEQIIADLYTIYGAPSEDRQITLTQQGMIMATAQVRVRYPVRGSCRLYINDGEDPNRVLWPISESSSWDTHDEATEITTLTLVGYATKEPGVYNIALKCRMSECQEQRCHLNSAALDTMIVWTAPAEEPDVRTEPPQPFERPADVLKSTRQNAL